MRHRRQGVVGSLFALGVFCCAAKVALSQPSISTPPRVSDIAIPSTLGYVIETHQPETAAPAPILIHIQEAHANLEAQQHIADILQQLIQQYGLRLVLVEGGSGDVSLTKLRAYGPPSLRKKVADRYFNDGVLTGEEYVDLMSDAPLTLWGVEDEALYRQGFQALLQTQQRRATLAPVTASIRAAAERLKPSLFDPQLITLDEQAGAFDAGSLDLAGYVDALLRLAQRQQLSLQPFPNLASFVAARELEAAIDAAKAQEEQRALMERLSQRLAASEVDALLAKAKQLKAGEATQAEFYEAMTQRASAVGLSPEPASALGMYLRYIAARAAVQPAVLGDELKRLSQQLRESLTRTPDSRRLAALLQQVAVMEKLLALKLTPDEYAEAQTLPGVTASWRAFLEARLPPPHLPTETFTRLPMVEEAVPKALAFYEIALRRDEALAENAIAKLRETREPIAVLITGGFHGPRMTQRLKEQGLGLVMVAPRVSHPTDERLYYALLKYKNGQEGTLEEIEAIVQRDADVR